MKKIANCIHHTHWDPLWYFSAQDAMVSFTYNMKELLRAFDEGKVKDFFMDGQSAAVQEYLELHPEDASRIRELIKSKKLFVGPFHSQLDCFISSGEAVINNLRLGMTLANKWGGTSQIAYLPDSFGHSYDFPKIFNQFNIHDFVITRGVGDEYDLGSEFYMNSNDGSKLLVCAMLSGYGYGAYPFKEGTLLTNKAEDYNRINLSTLIARLIDKSTVNNEFVFPLGFDQNPAILNIEEKIEHYNNISDDYHFYLTTWEEYMKKVREKGEDIKDHRHELYSTQFHRIHRSIFSGRADIKSIQDETERVLTYELQPLMSMLDHQGIPYDQSILDKAWETLVRCQTHASATLTDETNQYVKEESLNALRIAKAGLIYLEKVIALSVSTLYGSPLVVFHTLPYERNVNLKADIYTKHKNFKLVHEGEEIDYVVLERQEGYNGVLRRDKALWENDKYYFKTTVLMDCGMFEGISYKTIFVKDEETERSASVVTTENKIENARYQISLTDGGIIIYDKVLHKEFRDVIHIEDSGDEGDNYDYSYPDKDMVIEHHFKDATCKSYQTELISEITLNGSFSIPKNLESREMEKLDATLSFSLTLMLDANTDVISIKGKFTNVAENHRVRIVIKGEFPNKYSYAGTQYSVISRETAPKEMSIWREKKYFEEPSPNYPMLNFVSAVSEKYTMSAFTRSVKEYEFIGEAKKDIALTVFRAVGHLGLPDLNRRPGRPSGLDYMIFETPQSQMKGEIFFNIGMAYYEKFDANIVTNDYVVFATDVNYYQNQKFEKTIFPITYFPVNPLDFKVPENYTFLSIDKFACFGTVVKSSDGNGYILRVFNASDEGIPLGKRKTVFIPKKTLIINLLEEELGDETASSRDMKPGELRNIKLIP